MDWIKRLNQAIDFIEKNLDGELDYEDECEHSSAYFIISF